MECGVSKKHYSIYDFSDHVWSQVSPATGAHLPRNLDLLELANRCVYVASEDQYLLKIPNSTRWISLGKPNAIRYAKNTWINGKLSSGTIIDNDLISIFFSGKEEVTVNKQTFLVEVGSCPIVSKKVYLPLGPRYVKFNNIPAFNDDTIEIIKGKEENAHLGLKIVRMIYRSLCNGPELDHNPIKEEAILAEQILTDKMLMPEFKFIMNWLALIYQFPGINLQTNLWILGQQYGIGKGTLIKAMKGILGSDAVNTLNKDELIKGFNGSIAGKILVEVSEFKREEDTKFKKAFDYEHWLKDNSCEEYVSIQAKGANAYNTVNISNYIITGNEENPIDIRPDDRRNCFIRTTDDKQWQPYAINLNIQLDGDDRLDYLSGFAYWLDNVKANEKVVNKPLRTELQMSIAESSKDDIDDFIDYMKMFKNKPFGRDDFYKEYVSWTTASGLLTKSAKDFGRKVKQMRTRVRYHDQHPRTYTVLG